MLMIKVAAAMLLLLGSGLVFKALVAMDAPTLRLRSVRRRRLAASSSEEVDRPAPLRRAA